MLLQQFEYEETAVRGGQQLLHSPFFQVLIALACDLRFDRYVIVFFLLQPHRITNYFINVLDCPLVLVMGPAGRGSGDTALQPGQLQDSSRDRGYQNRLLLR